MENTSKIEEIIENALKENKNLLIQALPGSGKNHLTEKSAEKVGVILAEFETTEMPYLGGLPNNAGKNINDSNTEDTIIASLKDKNANAILLNTISGDNIDMYVNVAKKTKLPLIISNTTNDRACKEIDVKVFDNVEDLNSAFPSFKKFESTAIKNRVINLRLKPEDISVTESPKVK